MVSRKNTALLLALICGSILVFAFPPQLAQGKPVPQTDICTGEYLFVSQPLDQLGADEYIRMDGVSTGFIGGLYPDGENVRPPEHEAAGVEIASSIRPLNSDGQVDETRGKIVLVSIGMSNTNSEFAAFTEVAGRQPDLNPNIFFLNGALGNQTADKWIDSNALAWQELDNTMERYQISPLQVQAAWVKLTLTRGGEFPAKAIELQNDLEIIARNLKSKFPNLRIAYYSSRTRSYTYWRGLSPEPLAFETAFAVRWMIEKQINGDPALNFDPDQGSVVAPYLSWGPYLWSEGGPEAQDPMAWAQADLTIDCTHPSPSGLDKVANALYDFFSTDSTAREWFLAVPRATITPEPTYTQTYIPLVTTSPEISRTVEPTRLANVQDTSISLPPLYTNTAVENQQTREGAINARSWIVVPIILVVGLVIGLGIGWIKKSSRNL